MKNRRTRIFACLVMVLLCLPLFILISCSNESPTNGDSTQSDQTTDSVLTSHETESAETAATLDLTNAPYKMRSNVTLSDIKLIYQECEQLALTYDQILLPNYTIKRVLTAEMVDSIQSDTVSAEDCLKHLNNVRMLFNFRLAQELDNSIFFLEPYGHADSVVYPYQAVICLNTDTTPFQNWSQAVQHAMPEQRDYDFLTFYYAGNMNVFAIETFNLLEIHDDQRQSLTPSAQTELLLTAIEAKRSAD